MKHNMRWTLTIPACLAGATALVTHSGGVIGSRSRSVELDETVKVAVPRGTHEFRLWIPRPPDGGPQSAELVGIDSPLPYEITSEPEFGNQTVFLKARRPEETLEIRLKYHITRRPEESSQTGQPPQAAFRTPRGLLAVNAEIREIAGKQTQGIIDPIEKGRALCRYVLRRMAYDKSGKGWGRGDSIYACRVGKGNCTDFHSLFIALSIASGIPARFRMGLLLPEASEGAISGYHCWAEFYAKNSWIPVDISEAWKNPKRADYYFGHLDVNRVLVSTGREIRLSPSQNGPPLNFFYRPYAEADGKPLDEIEFVRTYKNLGGRA